MASLAFLGLPSLHEIIEGIATGFFGALAHALVPSWLTHGTVATIQHLVALPDPTSWTHVGQLQDDMVYLGAMLLPATLAVGTVRYWLVGLTGAAHPAIALGRGAWVTVVLVAYRWFVAQIVAVTNTLTHAILSFPVVAAGLQRIIGVLFGGALLGGVGGVFGALLVIVGVVLAAGLFAAQVLVTLLLAVLVVAGPPLIALSVIPELSHLARTWAHALLAIALVPLGWTVLFATAGALCLDATSFTGGAGDLPSHVAAAFAGLITFAIAVKLPLMALGEMRHIFGAASAGTSATHPARSTIPGAERVRSANARLRTAALEGAPSLGRSVGRAAGALGAPAGGAVGATRRGLLAGARRAGFAPAVALGVTSGAVRGSAAAGVPRERRGVRKRLRDAGAVLAAAPREARTATAVAWRRAGGAHGTPRRAPQPIGTGGPAAQPRQAGTSASAAPPTKPVGRAKHAARGSGAVAAKRPVPRAPQASAAPGHEGAQASVARSDDGPAGHPAQRVKREAEREATRAARAQRDSSRQRPPRTSPPPPAPVRKAPSHKARRKPRPRSKQ